MTDLFCGNTIITMPDAVTYVVVNGKRVHFDFHEYCGPTVLDVHGEPAKRQPGERNPFWPVFNEWLNEWWKLRPYYWAGHTDGKPRHHWQKHPTGWKSRCGKWADSLVWRAKTKQCAACLSLSPAPERTEIPSQPQGANEQTP